MMKILDRYIEWVVALAIVSITTFSVFGKCVDLFAPAFMPVIIIFKLSILMLMIVYQVRHYGIKIKVKSYIVFFALYSFYVFLYLTVLRVYPLSMLKHVHGNIWTFFIYTAMIFGYLLCAKTILAKFNVRKYIYLSIVLGLLPSLWYINFVGVDFIQFSRGEDDEEDLFIHQLALAFSNVPIWVLCILFRKNLHDNKYLNYTLFLFVFFVVSFILIISTKRGPIIWAITNLIICFGLISRKILISLSFITLLGIITALNIDIILEKVSIIAPRTTEQFEKAIYEGNTSYRLDTEEGKGGYTLALNQIYSSPIWGSYFRIIVPSGHWKGHYPHNIFLEMLMTMGLVGFIPFVFLLFKAGKNIYITLRRKHTDNQLALISLFLASFLEAQSTGTIVQSSSFWVLFYIMMLIYRPRSPQQKTMLITLLRNRNKCDENGVCKI